MLDRTSLSVLFALDDRSLTGGSNYANARPLGDFLTTCIVELRLELTSVYLGSGEFTQIPALHKISDPVEGNGSYSAENLRGCDTADPSRPIQASRAYLYDHLAQVQQIVRERRGEVLLVGVGDEIENELTAADAAALAS